MKQHAFGKEKSRYESYLQLSGDEESTYLNKLA